VRKLPRVPANRPHGLVSLLRGQAKLHGLKPQDPASPRILKHDRAKLRGLKQDLANLRDRKQSRVSQLALKRAPESRHGLKPSLLRALRSIPRPAPRNGLPRMKLPSPLSTQPSIQWQSPTPRNANQLSLRRSRLRRNRSNRRYSEPELNS
jgi:hypothetical protein